MRTVTTFCTVALALSLVGDRADAQRITIVNDDGPTVLWAEGELSLRRNGKRDMTLGFSLDDTGKLDTLSISNNGVRIDLSNLVRDLVRPFPLRSRVTIIDASKEAPTIFSLSIPFLPEGGSDEFEDEPRCSSLDVRIAQDKIVETEVTLAPQHQCSH
jgi:hypothetical protein